MTETIELVDKNKTKTAIINISHIFKKSRQSLSIKRDLKSSSKNANLNTR